MLKTLSANLIANLSDSYANIQSSKSVTASFFMFTKLSAQKCKQQQLSESVNLKCVKTSSDNLKLTKYADKSENVVVKLCWNVQKNNVKSIKLINKNIKNNLRI